MWLFKRNIKSKPISNNLKTIVDYGGVVYKTRLEAINGKDSSKAIQDMVNDVGTARLPDGWIKNEKRTVLYKAGQSVIGAVGSNRSVNLISTKPIDMFIPTYRNHKIKGFTAWYIGKNITKECGVVRYGGVSLPHGAIYETYQLDHSVKEWKSWKQRTQCISNDLDFDFEGDINYVKSRSSKSPYPYNKNFIENSGAHCVWIDYDNEIEDNHSHFHSTKIRGNWRYVNTGLKITTKSSGQSLNGLDMKVHIRGFRQVCNISKLSMSKIVIEGQHQFMMNWNKNDPKYIDSNKYDWEEWKVPSFEITGKSLHCDIFNNDRHRGVSGINQIKAEYHVKELNTAGQNNLGSWAGDNLRYSDSKYNDSTFVNHSVVNSLKRLPKEAIKDLKEQLKK